MTRKFQADGPGVIGSDLCQVCGKELYEHTTYSGDKYNLELAEKTSHNFVTSCGGDLQLIEDRLVGYFAELHEARAEAQTCDDINLDQPLAGIIADLQKDREQLRAALSRDEQKAKAMGENW